MVSLFHSWPPQFIFYTAASDPGKMWIRPLHSPAHKVPMALISRKTTNPLQKDLENLTWPSVPFPLSLYLLYVSLAYSDLANPNSLLCPKTHQVCFQYQGLVIVFFFFSCLECSSLKCPHDLAPYFFRPLLTCYLPTDIFTTQSL